MTQPNLRETAAAEARGKILAAAAQCIVRDGLAQVRMAKIARVAGVSSGLVHYHFATKEQLLSEVLRWTHGESAELNRQAMRRAGDGAAERLGSFLDRCLPSDPRLEHEWLLWQELALLCMRQPELAQVGTDLYAGLYRTAAQVIRDGVDQGVFAPAVRDHELLAETLVALCDGLGSRVLTASEDLSLEGARTAVADAAGVLVGHAGPLPMPTGALAGARR